VLLLTAVASNKSEAVKRLVLGFTQDFDFLRHVLRAHAWAGASTTSRLAEIPESAYRPRRRPAEPAAVEAA
jgi:hypothetical protein